METREMQKKSSSILLDYEEKSQTVIFQTGGNDRKVNLKYIFFNLMLFPSHFMENIIPHLIE